MSRKRKKRGRKIEKSKVKSLVKVEKFNNNEFKNLDVSNLKIEVEEKRDIASLNKKDKKRKRKKRRKYKFIRAKTSYSINNKKPLFIANTLYKYKKVNEDFYTVKNIIDDKKVIITIDLFRRIFCNCK